MEADLLLPGRFYRSERIKSSDEIRNLFKNGERVSVSGAKLFFLPNNLKINRIAFTLSRHYGSAVKRNRSKRYSREVYRSFKTYLNAGYDLLLLVYPGNDSFGMRYVQFSLLCDKAGLLKK
ncbi:ribonuclease P protein component [Treponema parvum]|uniref:Ribonuclease P protein component n=1 Tax=Treponema parvum TaxID=138851 RepID=A0A975F242_9SPIR|nr:ribonuclease P protein component [Treponema parvum]QTQ12968.1 ribonuclease P protein component [Treponema parvum]